MICLTHCFDNLYRKMKTQLPSINVKLIISLNRRESIESAEENVNLAIEYSKSHPTIICGVDLSGDPACKIFSDFEALLTKARNSGLKLALHCGEVENREDEIGTMLKFGMNRLGHGTFIKGILLITPNSDVLLSHFSNYVTYLLNFKVKMRKFF